MQDFIPTLSMPNLWTIQDALDTPNTNERPTAMGIEIESMGRLNVLKTVPHLPNMNIITP